MKANEFAAMKPEDLEAKIADLKTELFNLRFKLATNQLENTMQLSVVKRDIARAKTVQRMKQNQTAAENA